MRILLVGNYLPDRQESMIRYAELLRTGLLEAGHNVRLVIPPAVLNAGRRPPQGLWKWVGYLDKYGASVPALRKAARAADIVHVCDHSNAVYVPQRPHVPHVVTCHDLLAVRGARGEIADCPASVTGRYLQRSILSGLGRAHAIACVSAATLRDARKLLPQFSGEMVVTPNALHHPYRVLDSTTVNRRLGGLPGLDARRPFVLNVGSNERRKNREAVMRAVAQVSASWSGYVVFAGQPLSSELHTLARSLGIADRVVEINKPSNDVLEALYCRATALLFPTRFEGFGWPIPEAQACGCPVICGNREPLPEVSGGAAVHCDPDDIEALATAIIRVERDAQLRDDLRRRGIENAARFDRHTMIERFVGLYRRALSPTNAHHELLSAAPKDMT